MQSLCEYASQAIFLLKMDNNFFLSKANIEAIPK